MKLVLLVLVGGFDWFFFEKFSFPQLRRWLTLLVQLLFNIWFLVMLWKRLKTFSFHHLHHHPLRYLRRHRTSRGSNCHAKVAWSVWNPYSCPHSKYPAQQWRHRMPKLWKNNNIKMDESNKRRTILMLFMFLNYFTTPRHY